MNLPDLKNCPPVVRQWLQPVLDYCASIRIRQGAGIYINETPTGTQVSTASGTTGNDGGTVQPFTLSKTDSLSFRVYASTLGGGSITDLGFSEGDTPPYVVTVSATGKFWGGVTIDTDTGDLTSRFLDYGASLPDDTADTFYVEIGTYNVTGGTLTVSNTRYGPIGFIPCRNLFDAEFPWRGTFS